MLTELSSDELRALDATMKIDETLEARSRVPEACGDAIDAIETLPVDQWPEWICFILEGLGEELALSDHEDWRARQRKLLEDVEADIETRLEEGRW